MKKETGQYSSFFVIIGIILVALVAGTTYSAYQRDLDVLRVEKTSSYAPSIHSLNHDLDEVQFYQKHPSIDSLKIVQAQIGNIEAQLADIKKNSENFSKLPGDGAAIFRDFENWVGAVKVSITTPSAADADLLVTNQLRLEEFDKYVKLLLNAEIVQNEQLRASIKSGAKSSIILSFLTVLLSILGMAHFIRLNSQNELMASHNKDLAQRADAGNRAKSRLLTMLSHEIRTPMNGVLGLVSLSLQQKQPEPQRKLLEQIKGSAMELISFLEDMLDFSSLDHGENEMRSEPILIEDVKQSLLNRLASISKRQGTDVKIEFESNAPSVVLGDNLRIQQALFYFLNFILKNSYQREITCRSDIYDNTWLWRIDLIMNDAQGEKWQINSLVGESEGNDFITSDTIETTIARGLIDSMKGELKLIRGQQHPEQYRLLAYIPILQADQITTLKIGRCIGDISQVNLSQMFKGLKFEEIDQSEFGNADFVICEGKTVSDYQRVSNLRNASPKAKLIHIGQTLAPQLYDCVVNPPKDWLIDANPKITQVN